MVRELSALFQVLRQKKLDFKIIQGGGNYLNNAIIQICNAIQYNTIQYNTIQYNTIQCNTIQYNTIQCNTMQYNTIQYNTIPIRQGIKFLFWTVLAELDVEL